MSTLVICKISHCIDLKWKTCNNKTSHSIAKPCFFGETEADIKVTKILTFIHKKTDIHIVHYTSYNINREKYYVRCRGGKCTGQCSGIPLSRTQRSKVTLGLAVNGIS